MNDIPLPGEPSPELELATLIEHRRELLLVLDDDGRLAWLGPAARSWFGADVKGAALAELVHPADEASLRATLADLLAASGQVARTTCRLPDRSGEWRLLELSITDRRGRPGVGGLVCVARDAGDEMELTARLIHRATHDSLTALPNRACLLDLLDAPGESPAAVTLLYIDLDGFKQINDTYGHAAGDRVLVTVADRLRRAVRPGDTVARIGGDEFVVVAEGVSDGSAGLVIAERVTASVCRPIVVGSRQVSVGASVGVAVGRRDQGLQLLDEADKAMYGAKRQGTNRCALYDQEMRHYGDQRGEAEQLLRDALDHDGICVLYQPVVELATGRVAALDATLRLRDRDGSLSPSTDFLQIAEETGLSVALGAGLLDLACAQLATWHATPGGGPPVLGVPMSARQLADRHATERVAATLAARGVDPLALCLHLPEVSLLDADSALVRTLQRLKGLGVRLAVDDYGTGRGSLPYLRRFGVDMLRLDAGFVRDLGGGDTDHAAVLAALVGLGANLGLTVVAKGVERAEQAEAVAAADCSLALGGYFGEPTPPTDR